MKSVVFPCDLFYLLTFLLNGGIHMDRNSSIGSLNRLVKCHVCCLFVFPVPAVVIGLLYGLCTCHVCHFLILCLLLQDPGVIPTSLMNFMSMLSQFRCFQNTLLSSWSHTACDLIVL